MRLDGVAQSYSSLRFKCRKRMVTKQKDIKSSKSNAVERRWCEICIFASTTALNCQWIREVRASFLYSTLEYKFFFFRFIRLQSFTIMLHQCCRSRSRMQHDGWRTIRIGNREVGMNSVTLVWIQAISSSDMHQRIWLHQWKTFFSFFQFPRKLGFTISKSSSNHPCSQFPSKEYFHRKALSNLTPSFHFCITNMISNTKSDQNMLISVPFLQPLVGMAYLEMLFQPFHLKITINLLSLNNPNPQHTHTHYHPTTTYTHTHKTNPKPPTDTHSHKKVNQDKSFTPLQTLFWE